MTDIIEDHPIFEDYQPEPYKVYAQIDSENIITAIGSSGFIQDTEGWVQIDEGYDNVKHQHAQGNYLPKGLIDEQGCCNYKLVDGEVAERSLEEKQAEIDARPAPPPTPEQEIVELKTKLQTAERIAAETSETQQALLELLIEMEVI